MEKYLSDDNKEVAKHVLGILVASWGVNEFTILHSSDVPAKNTLLKPMYIFQFVFLLSFQIRMFKYFF